jgi:nicotinamidase-related amidase
MNASKTRAARAAIWAIALVCAAFAGATRAQSIIDEWSSVKAPPPPELKKVTFDRKTTALLLLDFNEQTCNQERRPRCIASIPRVKKLLSAARQAGIPVAFTVGGGGKATDISKELAPGKDEPVVSSGLDKFVGTDLESFLKQHGVRTVVVAGVAANGAVLYTATTAAERGMKVVVPVDGISAEGLYPEQYTTWHLVNAPRIGTSVTLTTIDDVKF